MDPMKFKVTSNVQYIVSDYGPKYTPAGHPWLSSIEGGFDLKEVYSDGTIVVSPHRPGIISESGIEPNEKGSIIRIPGGTIRINVTEGKTTIKITNNTSIENATIPKTKSQPTLPGQKRKRRHHEHSHTASNHSSTIGDVDFDLKAITDVVLDFNEP